MKVVNSVLELIGDTPMIRLNKVTTGVEASIFAKLEFLNPSGSIKDRIAIKMIEEAEKAGLLKPSFTIVEPSSGNTDIAFSLVAAMKGYKMTAIIPKAVSGEWGKIIKTYGADVLLTPPKEFAEGSIKKAEELAKKPEVYLPNQFSNPENVAAHRETTAKEIWEQTGGKVDAFVAGVGTGGTLIGVAEGLKEKKPSVKIVAVEPAESPVLSGGKPSLHRIDGIGDGFISEILKQGRHLIDEVITVIDEDAIKMTRRLIMEEGLFVGISSGANVHASTRVAEKLEKEKTVVTVLPDNAYRYFSTELFKDL